MHKSQQISLQKNTTYGVSHRVCILVRLLLLHALPLACPFRWQKQRHLKGPSTSAFTHRECILARLLLLHALPLASLALCLGKDKSLKMTSPPLLLAIQLAHRECILARLLLLHALPLACSFNMQGQRQKPQMDQNGPNTSP